MNKIIDMSSFEVFLVLNKKAIELEDRLFPGMPLWERMTILSLMSALLMECENLLAEYCIEDEDLYEVREDEGWQAMTSAIFTLRDSVSGTYHLI